MHDNTLYDIAYTSLGWHDYARQQTYTSIWAERRPPQKCLHLANSHTRCALIMWTNKNCNSISAARPHNTAQPIGIGDGTKVVVVVEGGGLGRKITLKSPLYLAIFINVKMLSERKIYDIEAMFSFSYRCNMVLFGKRRKSKKSSCGNAAEMAGCWMRCGEPGDNGIYENMKHGGLFIFSHHILLVIFFFFFWHRRGLTLLRATVMMWWPKWPRGCRSNGNAEIAKLMRINLKGI